MSRVAPSCSCFSPSGWPTSGRPARPRSSPTAGHVPASAALPARPHGQGAFRPGLGRPRRRGDLRVPGPPRGGPAQQPAQPQRPPRRAAVAVPLHPLAPSRTRPAHPAGARDPAKALRQGHRVLPTTRRSRRPAGRPDLTRWEGRRDRALIALAVQTGLRLSELTSLRCGDAQLGAGAHVRCTGKGRKQRCVPLTTATAAIVRAWQRERGRRPRRSPVPHPHRPPPQRRRGRSAHRRPQGHRRPALPVPPAKKLTPHTLWHTAAMTLLREGITSPSSPCGWATPTSAPPTPTSTPT